MSTSALTIGWIRKLPKLSTTEQQRRLTAAGADRLVIDGRRDRDRPRETWRTLLKMLRPGDVVLICNGRALIDPSSKAPARRQVFAALAAIEEAGGTLHDLQTGCDTAKRAERDEFLAGTLDAIARARDGGDAGRPPWTLTAEQRAWSAPIWYSMKVATNKEAETLIRAEAAKRGDRDMMSISAWALGRSHRLGPSGRAKLKRKKR